MRHEPFIVSAVATQAAANLVVDAAVFHRQQSFLGHLQTFLVAGAEVVAQ